MFQKERTRFPLRSNSLNEQWQPVTYTLINPIGNRSSAQSTLRVQWTAATPLYMTTLNDARCDKQTGGFSPWKESKMESTCPITSSSLKVGVS